MIATTSDALLGGALTLIVLLVGILVALLTRKMERIEDKVDGLGERMSKLEGGFTIMDRELGQVVTQLMGGQGE